jgi:hypothetical protein
VVLKKQKIHRQYKICPEKNKQSIVGIPVKQKDCQTHKDYKNIQPQQTYKKTQRKTISKYRKKNNKQPVSREYLTPESDKKRICKRRQQ